MAKTTVLSRALVAGAALALASSLAGCGPSVPAAPTYEANVRPILAAHCLNCHGNAMLGDGAISADAIYAPPAADTPAGNNPPTQALTVQHSYLGQCTSTGCDMDGGGAASCRRGAQYFATTPPPGASGSILSDVIHGGEGFFNPMPPPPAAALDDWELKVIDAWIANPVCGSDAGS